MAHTELPAATLEASARRRRALWPSPLAAASPASFPHASKNAGMALGSSMVAAILGGPPASTTASLAALGASGVTEFGAPVVRGGGAGKVEGRDPPVSRAMSRPSKSGRQDLNLRPLGPEGSLAGSDTVGSDPFASDVPGIIRVRDGLGSDTFGSERSTMTAPGTIQAQRTLSMPALLTVAEAAGRLRLSRATVYRLVAEGRLESVRVSSGSIRIAAKD